jgi:NADPH2:quinone reductase
VSTPGSIEALAYTEVEPLALRAGEVRVRLQAIGVNYIDIHHRTGFYALPLPFTPGSEAAGVVIEVGSGVTGFNAGDRVAYALARGAYAEQVNVPADMLVHVPDGVDLRIAAAAMLQGMTAHYLMASTYVVTAETIALVHAAAGGVGGLLVQMAKQRGARVLATASTSKLGFVRELGADVVIDYTAVDFQSEVLSQTHGEGVHVVYDAVGKTTFDKSLECVRTRGMLVSYGQASGPVPPFDPLRLGKKGIYLTRPSLGHYLLTRAELEWRARELFEAIRSGALRVRIDREIPLRDAGEAHACSRVADLRQAAPDSPESRRREIWRTQRCSSCTPCSCATRTPAYARAGRAG